MMVPQHCTRVDTLKLKSEIERRLGRRKADKYFSLLLELFSLKVRKPEFDGLCVNTIGRENLRLHNHLIRSIVKNACLPGRQTKRALLMNKKKDSGTAMVPDGLWKHIPRSPEKVESLIFHGLSFKDHRTMPQTMEHEVKCGDPMAQLQEPRSATELLSMGSRPPSSSSDGEEVVQCIRNSSSNDWRLIKAPIGVPNSIDPTYDRTKVSYNDSGFLPGTSTLRDILERRLGGFKVSIDCADLLNHGLDIFLKELIKPCLVVARSRGGGPIGYAEQQKPVRFFSASVLDFQVALESDPALLGQDWPIELEKVCLRE